METYLVKEGCGTHIVFDQGELERHLKMGWAVRPDDWLEKQREEKKRRRLEALKAEQEALEAEVAQIEQPAESEQPKRRGRPRTVTAE